MKSFLSVDDVESPEYLAEEALRIKFNPAADGSLGSGKSMCLILFNPSLRTRLSSIRAAENLGMKATVFNVSEDGWQLEFEDGVVMDQGKAEHIREAAAVIGSYFDVIGIRSFPQLQSREEDYSEQVLTQFQKHSGVPIINLESCTVHPLQSLTDLMTIRESFGSRKPKVVLSWAPHPRALPQAVANSFSEWMLRSEVDLVITHPKGMELSEKYTKGAIVELNQQNAFEAADFVYAKNWSSYSRYGEIGVFPDWKITTELMALTNQGRFMHCLPVRRNVVVDDAVIDSANSLVLDQAENRIYAAQAVLKQLLTS